MELCSRGGTITTVLRIFIILDCIINFTVYSADIQDEAKTHLVSIRIYQLSKGKWDDSYKADFKKILVTKTNAYCDDVPSKCGFRDAWREANSEFVETNVVDVTTDKDKAYLEYNFTMTLPGSRDEILADNSPTKYYLHKGALNDTTDLSIDDFYDKTGYSIVKINHKLYPLKPDDTMNIIMITVACVLFLILLLVLFVLNWRCGRPPEPVDSDDDEEKGGNDTKLKPLNGNNLEKPEGEVTQHPGRVSTDPPSTISQAGQSDIKIEEVQYANAKEREKVNGAYADDLVET